MNEKIRVGRFIYMLEFGLWALKRRVGLTCFDPNNNNNNNNNNNVINFFLSKSTF
jgi:hypothetical protein